jgi:signal transduction histidine kinase
MPATFATKVVSGVALIAILLASVGILSYISMSASENERHWVSHTHTVLENLDELLDTAVRMDEAQRGYTWTGKQQYLARYTVLRLRIKEQFQQVRLLTADNPVQQQSLARLQPALESVTAGMEDRNQLEKHVPAQAALDSIRRDEVWSALDPARAAVSAMRQEEQRLLRERTAEVEESSRRTKIAIVLGNLLALGSLLFTSLLIQREMDTRQKAERNLNAVNQELNAFTYSAAHDLRAPLRHLHGFANFLQQSWYEKMDDDGRRLLDKILKSSQQMGQLLDDLLSFSRLGQVEFRRSRVSLRDIFERVLQELQPETIGRQVSWEVAELPDVEGDPSLLHQVFFNLISNALKYSRKREHARIAIAAQNSEGAMVTLHVRDNGAGFDMQYVNKLFSVFQRLHRAEEFEGTGIGLAIVRRIVERHGGQVWAEAETGKGATFYFSLPKWRENSGQARVHSAGR